MNKEYKVEGMSCGGCVASVKKALLQTPGVQDVTVTLQPPAAQVSMDESIPEADLQKALGIIGNYKITENE